MWACRWHELSAQLRSAGEEREALAAELARREAAVNWLSEESSELTSRLGASRVQKPFGVAVI